MITASPFARAARWLPHCRNVQILGPALGGGSAPRHVINPLSAPTLSVQTPALSPTPEMEEEGLDGAARSPDAPPPRGEQGPREGGGAGAAVPLRSPKGKGVFAKDKRKLREKRRSTGVAEIGEVRVLL